MFFYLAFKNTGICSVLCISGPKSIGIYSIFCVFAWLPQKTVKRKNAVIYSILWLSKSEKSSEKGVKTALFSDFRYPPNGGGGFCSWRPLWATWIPSKKLSPTLLKDFWCFSGPGVGGSAAWGAPHHRALVALGRSWRICQRTRVEPAEPNLSAYARQPARDPCWGDMGSWEQDLKAMLPHLGAMLVHLGAMLPHLGAMLARLGA